MQDVTCHRHGPQPIVSMGATSVTLACGLYGSQEGGWLHPESVSRGHLRPFEIAMLDEHLLHHDLPQSSPYEIPETVAYVCLKCGSVGVAADTATRDLLVDSYNLTCCGTTVIFHSSYPVLVEPASLGLPVQVHPCCGVAAVDHCQC